MTDKPQLPRVMRRPPAFTNADELWDKCREYFTAWEAANRPLTVVGLAIFLDVCKDTLNEYGKGTYDHLDSEFSVTIKKAKNYIENAKWEGALTGKYNNAVAIFDLKNNHGATDKVEHAGPGGQPLTSPTTVIVTGDTVKTMVEKVHDEF